MDICHAKFDVVAQYFSNGRKIPRKNLLDKTRKRLLKECGTDAPADIRIYFCTKAGLEKVMKEAYRRCTDDGICPPKIPALLSAWD